MLTPDQLAAIKQDYFDGFGPYQCACRQKLTFAKVRPQYFKLERAGVDRHSSKRGAKEVVLHYHGSPMIGVAITAPSIPIGPDWIGKPCSALTA